MRELEKERVRELLESSGSKGKKKMRGCTLWWVYVCGKELLESSDGYTCVVDKMQEKKKKRKKGKVWMKEKAKNKKSPFKNNTTIFSQ